MNDAAIIVGKIDIHFLVIDGNQITKINKKSIKKNKET